MSVILASVYIQVYCMAFIFLMNKDSKVVIIKIASSNKPELLCCIGWFFGSAIPTNLSLAAQFLPKKKPAKSWLCYPTWIRTKTNRIRICRTTVILSGNGMQR